MSNNNLPTTNKDVAYYLDCSEATRAEASCQVGAGIFLNDKSEVGLLELIPNDSRLRTWGWCKEAGQELIEDICLRFPPTDCNPEAEKEKLY